MNLEVSPRSFSPPDDLADRLADFAAANDETQSFPRDSLALLRDAGLHRLFAPVAARGIADSDHGALREALRFVGRCDLSLGRLFEGHVNALLLFAWYADGAQLAWLSEALDKGAWLAVWATEPAPGVRIEGNCLSGMKSFASGAGHIDYALVTAADRRGERCLVLVPASDMARADNEGWRVRGMRATLSGRYDLRGIAVAPHMLLGKPGDYDREPHFTTGAWRFCAVQQGGIESLLLEIRTALAEGTPLSRARFADALAAARTAGFWVAEAASRAASEERDAVAVALLARGVVERAALDVMEAAAHILGTRSAFEGERADRIIRDLSLYLRQAGPDHARDRAAIAFLDHDCWTAADRLW